MWLSSRPLHDQTLALLWSMGSDVEAVRSELDPMNDGRSVAGQPENCLLAYLRVVMGSDKRVRRLTVSQDGVTVVGSWRRRAFVEAPPALRSFLRGATRGSVS